MKKIDNTMFEILERLGRKTSRRGLGVNAGRAFFKIMGVSVASQILSPYQAQAALSPACRHTGGQGEKCGQQGYDCNAGSCAGMVGGSSWQACCHVTDHWQKCTYTDKCKPAGVPVPAGCVGTLQNGLDEVDWCLGAGTYVCTESSCAGSFATEDECKK